MPRGATGLAQILPAGASARGGDRTRAIAHLREAIAALDRHELGLYAGAARRRRGVILGASLRAVLVGRADASITAHRVARPDRTTRVLAPGFGDG